LLETLGGLQLKDLKLPVMQPHWKNLLIAVVTDAVEMHEGRVIFFWDEMPLFIHNVATMCGAKEAMTLLDTLRSLRQSFPTLRMVFTGSVGMHQVVEKLRASGYANAPTNDMAVIEVAPLEPADAHTLASALLSGEGIEAVGGIDKIAEAIAQAAGYVPFYIHLLVARIHDEADSVDAEGVNRHIEGLIMDPNDPADFRYFEKRVSTYYGTSTPLALKVLDVLAPSETPVRFDDLLNSIRHSFADIPTEDFRELLVTLGKDHYLHKSHDNCFRFRNQVVQRWWHFSRVG
jgi:hypothetical protein